MLWNNSVPSLVADVAVGYNNLSILGGGEFVILVGLEGTPFSSQSHSA